MRQKVEGKEGIRMREEQQPIRCILFARGTTEGPNSVKHQIDSLNAHARRQGWTVVDTVQLRDRSADDPKAREAIGDLLKRKEELDDFDVLVVRSLDRITRATGPASLQF